MVTYEKAFPEDHPLEEHFNKLQNLYEEIRKGEINNVDYVAWELSDLLRNKRWIYKCSQDEYYANKEARACFNTVYETDEDGNLDGASNDSANLSVQLLRWLKENYAQYALPVVFSDRSRNEIVWQSQDSRLSVFVDGEKKTYHPVLIKSGKETEHLENVAADPRNLVYWLNKYNES